MVRAWIHSEQLAIEHVRNRRERMPVLRMNMGKRPLDASPGQASAHVRIVEHVKRIVVINELVTAAAIAAPTRECTRQGMKTD